jgi:predicted ATPase
MVDAFSIRNFKSFDDVHVRDCTQINVIVGDNGSGKTGLLEALFIAAGLSPELALRTRSWRGMESAPGSGRLDELEHALWGDLFHKFQVDRPAVVALRGAGEQERSVTIYLAKTGRGEGHPSLAKISRENTAEDNKGASWNTIRLAD